MMESTKEQSLETRLREIEDRLEIYNLIAAHPLSADTGADYYTRQVYTEDGAFDRGPLLPGATGREAVAAFTLSPAHQEAIRGSLAHLASLPYVEVAGDAAFVTSYLQIVYPDAQGEDRELSNHGFSKGFRIHRVVANRWSLVRTAAGWKIQHRTAIPLDGSAAAREILQQGLKAFLPQPQ